MAADNRIRSLSFRKRFAFGIVTAAALVAAVELISLAGLWAVDGKLAFEKLRDDQDRLAPAGETVDEESEVVHPYLGWVLNPHVHNARRSAKADSAEITVNEFGFATPVSPLQKRGPDRLIVGILGGSVAYFVATDGARALAAKLLESPRYAGKEIVIVPLAVSSYKQPQQLFVLTYLLALGAEFDIVINVDGYNEVALYPAEDAKRDLFYAMPRGWYRYVQTIPDPVIAANMFRLRGLRESRRQWAAFFAGLPYRDSATLNLVWRCRDTALLRAISNERIAVLTRGAKNSARYVETGPEQNFATEGQMFKALVALWMRSSLQLQRLCSANGIEYCHTLQPNQYLPESKPMGPAELDDAIYSDSEYGRAVAEAYPLLIRAGAELKKAGVHFLDLTQLFAGISDPIYVDNCCHYNLRGNELVAATIAQEILRRPAP